MSIQQIQTKNILEFIAQAFMVNGINPTTNQLLSNISEFFAAHPAGLPVMPNERLFNPHGVSEVDAINDFMAFLIMNIDTLYEVCQNQVDDILMLNTVLRTHLDRLKIMRKVLEHQVDDYLMGIFNSDGYFYSFSDSFANTNFTDLTLSNIFLDTLSTTISIPSVGGHSQRIDPKKIGEPLISIKDIDGNVKSWDKKSEFINALDGMTNTAWFFEVPCPSQTTLTVNMELPITTAFGDNMITKIDLIPHGVTPVQAVVTAVFNKDDGTSYVAPFSNQIISSADKISFVGDQIIDPITRIRFQLSKTEPDYVLQNGSANSYIYIFGFKEILLAEQSYDTVATFVSKSIVIPPELQNEANIDLVSLVTSDYIPTNTSIKYYVAADVTDPSNISDFSWREITPISDNTSNTAKSVSFDGSYTQSRMIRLTPRSNGDIQMITLNSTSPDLAKRNPTSSYLPGTDVYRICEFSDDFLAGTLKLEEGINTSRIYYTERDVDALTDGFAFWKEVFDSNDYFLTYGEIDSGNGFFSGANVGENSKSVYVETFIEVPSELPVFLKECRKTDANSKQWDLRLFLNGREIANMPKGIDYMTVPWKLKEGLNHVVLMVNIPAATVTYPTPYLGSFTVMTDGDLFDFGVVKLDNWIYVDQHKLQSNQVNQPNSFTIFNGEIISRKKPTNNFKLTFKKATSEAPTAIRLRADLTRSEQYAKSTPIIDSYRLRFSYR